MYRKWLSSAILVLVLGLILADVANADLVGWWKFDETSGTSAADSSGSGNDGLLMNGGTWTTGQIGGAVELDGTDDYVSLPVGALIGTLSNASFMVWVNYQTGQYYARVFDFGTGTARNMFLLPAVGTTGNMRFAITTGGWTAESQLNAGSRLATGWHHVAVVIDGEARAMQLLLDGVVVASGATNTLPQDIGTTTNNWLGRSEYGSDAYYLGSLDDFRIYNEVVPSDEIKAIMLGVGPNPGLAGGPYPSDQATDVPREAVLTWMPGLYAASHDVYFGTALEDVSAATRADPRGVLVSQGQDARTYEPADLPTYGQTYYWRVDEVNAPPDATVLTGAVWSFTAEPYAYTITPILATASSSGSPGTGPTKTIDRSGLDGDAHGTTLADMWLSGKTPQPAWIQYEFDQAYKLHQMLVWNSNQMTEPDIGYGAKEVTVETSTDGSTWTALAGVPEFAQATGLSDYVANTIVDFGGVSARFVRLTIQTNWGGLVRQRGLAEVRFFHIPVRARQPRPLDGAADVSPGARLEWRPGRVVAQHEVYLGTDPNALVLSKTVTQSRVALTDLGAEYDRTYYWRVDEVNEAATPASWEGPVWSFSTPAYSVVDDFETYNDRCDRVYYVWKGGTANSENLDCGVAAYSGNGTGSAVGHDNPPYAERAIVHNGQQSMPFAFDNTSGSTVSEATRTFDVAQDWTLGGIKTLVLFFYGEPGNGAGQLYAKINNTKVVYSGGANAMAMGLWKQWNIDLAGVAGAQAVQSLTIGVSGSARGRLFIDDIRLYQTAPEVPVPVDPGTAGLAAHYTFEGDVKDASGHKYDGTAMNGPTFQDSRPGLGQAIWFDGTFERYVELPIGTLISTLNSVTVTTWVNVDTTVDAGYQRVFDFGTSSAAGYMFLSASAGRHGVIRFAITSGSGESTISSPTRDVAGWHHMAVVIDGTARTMQLVHDGDVVAEGTTETLPTDLGQTPQNWLGRSQYDGDSYYSGALDDLRIYDRALSMGEVRYLVGDR
ncbi:MAG: discoidin domain-containing protein [Phycisphaerae bacterium]|nr:discoidin domain-containing protein [Phycisphaerae bacterium]